MSQQLQETEQEVKESPEYLRMSLAAAMTLGFKQGLFYRDARLFCVNLLLTYKGGCAGQCAYCGLSNNRPGTYNRKSFIRVAWDLYLLDEIIEAILKRQNRIKRICISMITNRRSVQDTKDICARLRSSFDIPVSLLITPTILNREDLKDFMLAGADKIGVAIDLATYTLFEKYRGNGVRGPHRWERYWKCLFDSILIFGQGAAGAHLMVGMGETERDMCAAIQKVRDMGARTHLFSFFPETNSKMTDHPVPPMAQYRRIQLSRYLIDNKISRIDQFVFNGQEEIMGFGLPSDELDEIISSGEPFRTSGCEGYDGEVACNRPFANSRPSPDIRNYPFPPAPEDITLIRSQMKIPHV